MGSLSKKEYTKKNWCQALGVGLVLFSLLCLLSAGTSHLWGLAAGICYLFGVEGLYLIVPFFIYSGIVLAVRGNWDKPDISGRVGYGFTIFALGVGMLWSHYGLGGTEKSSDFSIFRNAYDAYSSNRIGYYGANDLGGGVIGYFFAGVFSKPGLWLLLLIAIFLIVAGLVIIFLPLIKKLLSFLKGKLALNKSRRQASSERHAYEKSYGPAETEPSNPENRPLLGAPVSNENGYAAPLEIQAPSAPSPVAEPGIPSRVDLYAASSIKSPLPSDITPPGASAARPAVSPSQLYSSGLQQALFIPDGTIATGPSLPLPHAQPSLSAPVFANSAELSRPSPSVSSPAPAPVPAPVHEEKIVLSNEVSLDEEDGIEVPPAPAPIASSEPREAPAVAPLENPAQEKHAAEPAEPLPEATMDEEPIEEIRDPEPEPAPVSKPAPEPKLEPPKPLNPAGQPSAVARPKYVFPPLSLLLDPVDQGNKAEVEADCEATRATVDHCFSDFKVGAHVESYTIGPSVTRYNIMCDPNVSVTSISKYIDDISQRLNGAPARFQEVVRGQNTSGLEIPNKVTTRVPLKEMIAALPTGEKDNLSIPFGKTISGECLNGDLSKFPHMLVAGSTGSGKSIFMHSIIMSLIMRNRPEDLKIVLVDPKRVEMSNYADIPHLLCPIIKEPTQAKVCLDKLIKEMDRRYALFELTHVRDIRQFNHDYAPEHKLAPLPFIVVVVDEFADLVDTCKEVSDSVVRLAQKARAAGIHLIISTQRPSVDVITGVIKANLACRVALRVSQSNDSVVIIGQGGAEDLAGYGDMLVECETAFRGGFVRAQGAFVDTKELDAVCNFIKSEQPTVYDPEFLDLVDHEAEEKNSDSFGDDSSGAPSHQEIKAGDDEEYYQQLKAQVMTRQYTSISRIQRENGLGFPRAGRLFARLVNEGVVAPEPDVPGSSKGCRVLMHVDPNNGAPVSGSTDSLSNPADGHLGEYGS